MYQQLIDLLRSKEKYKEEHIVKYANYCAKIQNDPKSSFAKKYNENHFAMFFEQVAADSLVFDGVHITLQSTGISYDYIAYKNKMLSVYPESTVDVQIVREGDEFSFQKENGKVVYSHKINNPFNDRGTVIGAYCVIKNDRGEFLTTLNKADIDKHQKVARTQYIWDAWYDEMVMKTIIKKACKQHFADVFERMEQEDNKQYNLDAVSDQNAGLEHAKPISK